jgi:uncharacterized protein YjlB
MTEPGTFLFADDGAIPNSSLPLLLYRAAVRPRPTAVEGTFAANGWPPAWRAGVHAYHHFHAILHEALGVAHGTATVLFGSPNGHELRVSAGDIAIVPTGVEHCNRTQSADLFIVGACPDNAPRPDPNRGKPAKHDFVARKVAIVPPPIR